MHRRASFDEVRTRSGRGIGAGGVGLTPKIAILVVEPVAKSLAGLEGGHGAGGDCNGFAGAGIATPARRAVASSELAEPRDVDGLASLQARRRWPRRPRWRHRPGTTTSGRRCVHKAPCGSRLRSGARSGVDVQGCARTCRPWPAGSGGGGRPRGADDAAVAGLVFFDAVEIPAHVTEATKTCCSAWNADRALPKLPLTPTRTTRR